MLCVILHCEFVLLLKQQQRFPVIAYSSTTIDYATRGAIIGVASVEARSRPTLQQDGYSPYYYTIACRGARLNDRGPLSVLLYHRRNGQGEESLSLIRR